MNYEDLQKEIIQIHESGYNETLKKLIAAGFLRQKRNGEYHFNSTEAVKFLHKAIYDKDYDHYSDCGYDEYSDSDDYDDYVCNYNGDSDDDDED